MSNEKMRDIHIAVSEEEHEKLYKHAMQLRKELKNNKVGIATYIKKCYRTIWEVNEK